MSTIPSVDSFLSDNTTAEQRLLFEEWIKSNMQLPGCSAPVVRALVGSVLPVNGGENTILVRTEAAALEGSLDRIDLSSLPEGTELRLMTYAENETVTLVSGNTLSGGLRLQISEVVMKADTVYCFKRAGNHWLQYASGGVRATEEEVAEGVNDFKYVTPSTLHQAQGSLVPSTAPHIITETGSYVATGGRAVVLLCGAGAGGSGANRDLASEAGGDTTAFSLKAKGGSNSLDESRADLDYSTSIFSRSLVGSQIGDVVVPYVTLGTSGAGSQLGQGGPVSNERVTGYTGGTGGGGGGGGSHSNIPGGKGGNCGEVITALVTLTKGQTYPIEIGEGGPGSSSAVSGGGPGGRGGRGEVRVWYI